MHRADTFECVGQQSIRVQMLQQHIESPLFSCARGRPGFVQRRFPETLQVSAMAEINRMLGRAGKSRLQLPRVRSRFRTYSFSIPSSNMGDILPHSDSYFRKDAGLVPQRKVPPYLPKLLSVSNSLCVTCGDPRILPRLDSKK